MSDITTKDTMIKFKTTIRGKNSKGGDRLQLYLTQEESTALITSLTAQKDNEAGVKLDIHTSQRTVEATGKKFDSSIAFVKATGASAATGKKTVFVPRTAKKELA